MPAAVRRYALAFGQATLYEHVRVSLPGWPGVVSAGADTMIGLRIIDDAGAEGRKRLALGDASMPVKVVRIPIERAAESLHEVSLGLTLAGSLYAAGEHRDGCKITLLAVREMFRRVGCSQEQLAPLGHLFYALTDLDKGTIDPLLAKDETTSRGRREDPTATWRARAYAAAAVSVQVSQGLPLDRSAERIIQAIKPSQGAGSLSRRTGEALLIGWRKRFIASTAPAMAQQVYDLIIAAAARRPDRGEALLGLLVEYATETKRI